MFAVGVCSLPATGGTTGFVFVGLSLLVAGVIAARWVRSSVSRMSVVVAPLVLLGGLVLVPQIDDPCVPSATTTVASATTTVAPSTTTVASATTTVAPSTTTVAATTTTSTTTTTTTTTTIALTCATGGACVVGNPGPGGGIVFYDAGSAQAWGRYLEVACAGWQNGCDGTTADQVVSWGCFGIQISGAEGTEIGTGEQNTTDIVNNVDSCATAGTAAELADSYSNAGQSDWFLPSKDELNALCIWAVDDNVNVVCNGDGLGSFLLTNGGFSSGYYWSSSECGDFRAWYQSFDHGDRINFDKYQTYSVRPVRAF